MGELAWLLLSASCCGNYSCGSRPESHGTSHHTPPLLQLPVQDILARNLREGEQVLELCGSVMVLPTPPPRAAALHPWAGCCRWPSLLLAVPCAALQRAGHDRCSRGRSLLKFAVLSMHNTMQASTSSPAT